MHDLAPIPARVHMVGAGGAGMSGLAKILSQLGHQVTGSDVKPSRTLDALRDVGIETWVGHRPDAIRDVDLVVCSSAVPDRDAELTAARDRGIEVWRRPALLAALTAATPAIGIAGTHGKTTSSALAVNGLRGSGHDPSFLVGGEIVGLNTGAHVGSDDVFILEADEAFGTFRHLVLSSILVTNIEADHLDHYGSVAAVEDAFAQVVDRVPGARVGCIDDDGVRRLATRIGITTYGFAPEAMWRITDLAHGGDGVSFTLNGPDHRVAVRLPKPGSHLASNAAGVITLLAIEGFDPGAIAEAMERFSGVRRRYEIRAIVDGTTTPIIRRRSQRRSRRPRSGARVASSSCSSPTATRGRRTSAPTSERRSPVPTSSSSPTCTAPGRIPSSVSPADSWPRLPRPRAARSGTSLVSPTSPT
jgi:UDP-N-acetylmuramate--alanine ligase